MSRHAARGALEAPDAPEAPEAHRYEPEFGIDGLPVAMMRPAMDSSPACIAVTLGPQHRIAYQNQASADLFGARALGEPLGDAFPEMAADGRHLLDRVLADHTSVEVGRRRVGVPGVSGQDVWMRYVISPVAEPGGAALGLVITAIDVTAEERAESTAAQRRVIMELTDKIGDAQDSRDALEAVTAALVPEFADVAAVYVLRGTRDLRHGERAEPAAVTISPALSHLGPPPPPSGAQERSPWTDALASGECLLISVDETTLPRLAPERATAEWLTSADAAAFAIVPLLTAGQLTGALVLMSVGTRPLYSDRDLAFFVDVTARAGAAITHLATVGRQHQAVLDLQRALLPAKPPTMPDITVAARYVAGAADVEVGGDWWDVADLGAGRVALGVGDVSGRGLSAAVVMGQARAAMRAAGLAHLPPEQVLSLLDEQLAELVEVTDHDVGVPPRFATALYGTFEPGRQALTVANAGHLPLLVRSPAGVVEIIWVPPGAPLGVLAGGYTSRWVPLAAGSTVAMFTDGLVESREQDLDVGVRLLAVAFARLGGAKDADETAGGLLEALGRSLGHEDDVALVLMRPEPASTPKATYMAELADLAAVTHTRRAARDALAPHMSAAQSAVTEQILAELMTNALEHGASPAHIHAHVTQIRAVVEVTDAAPGRPVIRDAGEEDERGRGLALTAALASRWGVRTSPRGKTVWAEVLLAAHE